MLATLEASGLCQIAACGAIRDYFAEIDGGLEPASFRLRITGLKGIPPVGIARGNAIWLVIGDESRWLLKIEFCKWDGEIYLANLRPIAPSELDGISDERIISVVF